MSRTVASHDAPRWSVQLKAWQRTTCQRCTLLQKDPPALVSRSALFTRWVHDHLPQSTVNPDFVPHVSCLSSMHHAIDQHQLLSARPCVPRCLESSRRCYRGLCPSPIPASSSATSIRANFLCRSWLASALYSADCMRKDGCQWAVCNDALEKSLILCPVMFTLASFRAVSQNWRHRSEDLAQACCSLAVDVNVSCLSKGPHAL